MVKFHSPIPSSLHISIYHYSRLWPTKSSQRGPFISANRAASRMRRRGMSNLDSLALVKQELFPLGPGDSRSSRNRSTVKLGQKVSRCFQPKWPKTGSQQVLQMRRKPWQRVEMLLGATFESPTCLPVCARTHGHQMWPAVVDALGEPTLP